MMRQHWLWLSLVASTIGHGVFGWQLQNARLRPSAPSARDRFEVRMVALPPPPAMPPEPETPPNPEPPPPPPPPKAKPRPALVKAPPSVPEPAPEPTPQPPEPSEPTTAPPALLADSGSSTGGGIVQLAGASIGALATTSIAPAPRILAAPSEAPRRGAPLAKLSDLSRKPRAPSLDAALRQNYPVELRRRGTEGEAEVRVLIDGRGQVGEITVVSESTTGFAEACRRTLLGSRWTEPLDREGQAVSTRLTYRCRFQIER